MSFFATPWGKQICHPCPAGCCGPEPKASRQKSVERGLSLIMTVIFPHLCRPAANKYTKVHPVSLKVTLMLHFYGLLRRVLLRKCGSKAASSLDDDQSDFEDNAVLGVPDDVLRHFRKVGSKMLDNNASFVFDPFSKMRLLIDSASCSQTERSFKLPRL